MQQNAARGLFECIRLTLVPGRASHWRRVDRTFRPVSAYRYHTSATSLPRFARDVDLCVAPPYLPGAQGFSTQENALRFAWKLSTACRANAGLIYGCFPLQGGPSYLLRSAARTLPIGQQSYRATERYDLRGKADRYIS